MDVTFVLEESGATVTVEVPCDVVAIVAKETACKAFAVSSSAVEMRIGADVVEGTCLLSDTALGCGVHIVLARPQVADIRCPHEYSLPSTCSSISYWTVSQCGRLCVAVYRNKTGLFCVGGFDTESFATVVGFDLLRAVKGKPAISRCTSFLYLPSRNGFDEIGLQSGKVLRTVMGEARSVHTSGNVVAAPGGSGVSVYNEDLVLQHCLQHKYCSWVELTRCGRWALTTSTLDPTVRLWDVNTGCALASVARRSGCEMALSRSVFALQCDDAVQLYTVDGGGVGSLRVDVRSMAFTPCGQYLVVLLEGEGSVVHQYDVATQGCVKVIAHEGLESFVVSPCSRVIVLSTYPSKFATKYLYPYSE